MAVKTTKSKNNDSFFTRILDLILNRDDEDARKRKALKQISKEINSSKFKFYKPSTGEILPQLGKAIFEIYKTIGPAQAMLQNSSASKVLRSILIESSLGKEQLEAVDFISENRIRENAQTTAIPTLTNQVKEAIRRISTEFTIEKIKKLEQKNAMLEWFLSLLKYDYYFFLKKMDSALIEHNYSYSPKFTPCRAEYVLDDLRDFASIIYSLPPGEDWASIFAVLKSYKNVEVVAANQWNKVFTLIKNIKSSNILEYIIQHIAEDPSEKVIFDVYNEKVVELWLQKIKSSAEMQIQKIQTEKRNDKITELATELFGTSEVIRLSKYNENENEPFAKRMITGFVYAQPLNYLYSFLLDYFKKDIRNMVNLFLVRGQWNPAIPSKPFSDSFHSLMDISEAIRLFDESLNDSSPTGGKIRMLLAKADRNKDNLRVLRNVLKEVNEKAETFIRTAGKDFIIIGKNLKLLLEDYMNPKHEVINNWKEIIHNCDEDIKPWITTVYKKIYNLVMLLQFYVKD